MLRWKEGDRAQIADRAPTPADVRSQLFYGHYRKLTGTVLKLYGSGDAMQAALDVDLETLPEEIAVRHRETRTLMSAGIPAAARRAATPGEEFRLRYVVLVALTDLVRQRSAPSPKPVAKSLSQ